MDVGYTNEPAIELVYKLTREAELGGGWAEYNLMQIVNVCN